MSFQPIVPTSGLAGWRFLEKTYAKQAAAFEKDPLLARDTAYFEAKIGEINTAEELVADRRLLRVALGAFGLEDDINNKAFIKKILSDGTLKADALANRLADDRYKEFSKAFGFGDFAVPRTKLSYIGEEITSKFRRKQFEIAVGEQDDTLRLSLNAQTTLPEIASGRQSDDTKWFKIMGTPPLRKVFEVALGLPSSFAQLDLDKQLETFKERSFQQLGIERMSDLSKADVQDKLIQRFLLRSQAASFEVASRGSVALTLLQSMPNLFKP